MSGCHPPLPKSGVALLADGSDPIQTVAASGASVEGGLRNKVGGVRPWLVMDSAGQAQVVEAGKHEIMHRTGLRARDLRILDPLLSYPSTVLGRERAIIIKLEHIKAIITAQELLFLNSEDPSVALFVEEIQQCILRHHHQATKSQEGFDTNWTRAVSPPNNLDSFPEKEGKPDEKQAVENPDGPKLLPFEFVALEACLEAACRSLDNEARTLEQEAQPALDKLTSKISTLNWERVRHIKSSLVALIGRVQKVRDELEHLLNDDEDMAEMYLTDKLVEQKLENSSVSSLDEHDGEDDEVVRSDIDDRNPVEISLEGNGGPTIYKDDLQHIDKYEEQLFGAVDTVNRDSRGTRGSTTSSEIGKPLDVRDLEMLLEAYFVQIDGTLNKLSTLKEYVDDTEDYINIMLDDKQNQLLQLGVLIITGTLVIGALEAVTGLLAMNINIEVFNNTATGMNTFYWTTFGGVGGCIFLYVTVISWWKYKGLLD